MPADFDPRQAALHYAAEAERMANVAGDSGGDAVQALVCGLVYVGDQLGVELLNIASALTVPEGPEPDWTSADVAAVLDSDPVYPLVNALRKIAGHVEQMGDAPPDDEMREIARQALVGLERFERGDKDG